MQAPHTDVLWYERTGARQALLYVIGAGFQRRTQNSGEEKVGEKWSCLLLTNQESDFSDHVHKSHAHRKKRDRVHNVISKSATVKNTDTHQKLVMDQTVPGRSSRCCEIHTQRACQHVYFEGPSLPQIEFISSDSIISWINVVISILPLIVSLYHKENVTLFAQ